MKGIKMEPTPEQVVPVVVAGMGIVMMIFSLVMITITIFAFCKIFSKAGYHWAMGLIMFIPVGNLIMLLILAFGDWPILKELRALKTQPTHITEV